ALTGSLARHRKAQTLGALFRHRTGTAPRRGRNLMATPDPVEPAARESQNMSEPDARQVRILKIVVISLGVLLLVGFAVVIGRIAYLATQPGGGIAAAPAVHD